MDLRIATCAPPSATPRSGMNKVLAAQRGNLRAIRKASLRERFESRAWCWIVSQGLVPFAWPGRPRIGPAALELTGRRSGRRRSVAVTWVEVDGNRYLVSMLGEGSDWVHNARAADGAAALRRGKRRRVKLVELPVEERPRILQAWLKRTGVSSIPRKYVGLRPDSPFEEFERIAPSWPVFQIVGRRR